ncbi:AAA family ATPase [Aeribacillus sp. FSL K6-3256]|uniref:AAA family ATPase n=1 Tax=Aeribacillus TaxID=1055323 RepID=UPI0030D4B8E4
MDSMYENQNIRLERFEIIGLNGDKDVSLTFDNNIRILLGENGTGKTTILTTLYYILSRKFYQLNNIEFSEIHLHLSSNEVITLEKEWLSLSLNAEANRYYKHLENYLNEEELHEALNIVYGKGSLQNFRNQYYDKIKSKGIPFAHINRLIMHLRRTIEENNSYKYNEKIYNVDRKIKDIFNQKILYFPTYRRIEEELEKLGLNLHENLSNEFGIINFGMDDVQNIFNKIKNDIKEESLKSYSKVTGDMIKHLIYPEEQSSHEIEKDVLKNSEILKIVLDRFGNDLDIADKEYISNLIVTDKIFRKEYNSLLFYLNNLINNYMKHKKRDDSIKEFAKICNKYLVDKEVIFNESNGELFIQTIKKRRKVELSQLSSGEKQIVSILSRVFLDFNNNFIILFDEPELSLSIEWQEMLLPDIINSGKCSFLFAVTHSPFIFDNQLDKYAMGINMFVKERLQNYGE